LAAVARSDPLAGIACAGPLNAAPSSAADAMIANPILFMSVLIVRLHLLVAFVWTQIKAVPPHLA
jgi:hypothetical protein